MKLARPKIYLGPWEEITGQTEHLGYPNSGPLYEYKPIEVFCRRKLGWSKYDDALGGRGYEDTVIYSAHRKKSYGIYWFQSSGNHGRHTKEEAMEYADKRLLDDEQIDYILLSKDEADKIGLLL